MPNDIEEIKYYVNNSIEGQLNMGRYIHKIKGKYNKKLIN